jgi:phenylacetate-CoA ligase
MYNPAIETLPHDRLRALQDERLRHLVAYVYERVPFYRQTFERAGVRPQAIRSVDDLPKLPLTRKKDLRDHYPFGLFAVPPDQIARIHASSGTTGKPTVVGYTRRDLAVFAEVNARSLAAAGARPGMMLHNAYGYGLFTGGLGLHYGAEKLGMQVVPVSGGMTERQVLLILDFKPDVICCTPSYAQTLAEVFRQRGVAPEEISLKYALLGAEPWTEAIRADVDAGLGVQATNIYGLSEIIGPGVSQESVEERAGSYIWEDHFYPEIVDPDSGEPLPEGRDGVLVFTTLTKEAMPLLRYWTGDITALTRAPSRTGRTHVRMGPIKGRADDMLIIRGVNLYPTQIEAVLDGIAEVAPHYQLVIRRAGTLDEVALRLELSEPVFQALGVEALPEAVVDAHDRLRQIRGAVQHKIKESIGLTIQVSLLAPGEAPRSAGGKLSRVLDERAS